MPIFIIGATSVVIAVSVQKNVLRVFYEIKCFMLRVTGVMIVKRRGKNESDRVTRIKQLFIFPLV